MRRALPAALALALAAAAPPARAEAAHTLYMLHCQGCHLADGSGTAGAVPDLREALGDFLRVAGGRAYLVQVPGSAQSPLGDAELADVLNWMIRRWAAADVAAELAPYDAAEVARHRGRRLADVAATRAALLRALREENP